MIQKYILYISCLIYAFFLASACSSDGSSTEQEQHNNKTTVNVNTTQGELSPAAVKGKKIFMANCSACHLMSSAQLVGPGMAGVTEKHDREWLIQFISNSQKMIADGDEKAIAIYEEYNKTVMTNFQFTDEQFDNLLAYLKEEGK